MICWVVCGKAELCDMMCYRELGSEDCLGRVVQYGWSKCGIQNFIVDYMMEGVKRCEIIV